MIKKTPKASAKAVAKTAPKAAPKTAVRTEAKPAAKPDTKSPVKAPSRIESDLVRHLATVLDETNLTEIEYESGGLRIRVARGGREIGRASCRERV